MAPNPGGWTLLARVLLGTAKYASGPIYTFPLAGQAGGGNPSGTLVILESPSPVGGGNADHKPFDWAARALAVRHADAHGGPARVSAVWLLLARGLRL